MKNSWDYLESYRGTLIRGYWPTISEMFTISAKRFPGRPCFTCFDPERRTVTYREAERYIRAAAAGLHAQGVRPGDRVVISGKNSPEWAIAYLSALFAGAAVVPIDYQLDTGRIAALAGFAEASAACIDEEKLEEFRSIMPSSVRYLACLSPKGAPFFLPEPGEMQPEGIPVPRDEHDTAAILFTSGTTGSEKGVALTHANLMSDVFQACHPMFMTASEKDVWYALLPLHHSYTMTAVFLEAITHGSELVFAKRMTVRDMVRDLKQGSITMLMGIPLLFNKLLKGMMKEVRGRGLAVHLLVGLLMRISGLIKRSLHLNAGRQFFAPLLREAGLDKIRICICGGGPLAPETFRRYNELGLDFVQGYGLTETAPILTLNPLRRFKLRSVGRVFPLVDMKILDPDENGVGEIAVKGPNVSSGYFRDPEATKELFTADGYLKTGDAGYLDRENYLFLTGRKKSLIVTEGGKNVYPEEIEDHFQLYHEIEQILIKGYLMDRKTLAEGIEAVVYPSAEFFRDWSPEEREKRVSKIIAEVNKALLPYKRISRITLTEEPMETTTTRKIRRAEVLRGMEEKQ